MMRLALFVLMIGSLGCVFDRFKRPSNSPTAAGYNPRDLIDPPAQIQYERRANYPGLIENADKIRRESYSGTQLPKKNVLCISGGGSYGAFVAGVLCGWKDKPQFDVVTGVSTGALIAPFAFLGSRYDADLQRFYTTITDREIYRLRPFRALTGASIATNSPLARKIDETVTPELVAAIAAEHRKGRRIYIGTTELEGRRFVIWNWGAFADRGTPQDVETMKQILLGSAAIPAFFPPAEIHVTVDGKHYVEQHVDGGSSQAIFFQPPYVDPELSKDPANNSVAGTEVYAIVAGKLYADAGTVKPRLFNIGGNALDNLLYAQTRGDLQRIWTLSQLTGMNYHQLAIPEGYPAPSSATDFDPKKMKSLFEEGVRTVKNPNAWRTTPPGVGQGEVLQIRDGTKLNYETRGPAPKTMPQRP